MIYYKIRSKSNPELYVAGTPAYMSYTKAGRIFTTLGSLRTFLTGVINYERRAANLGDWEIVELEMQVKDTKEIHEIIKPDKLVKLLKQ